MCSATVHHSLSSTAHFFVLFYRSLRAVKVLLAALRSTLTVLASQWIRYRFALEEQLQCPFSESAQHIFKGRKPSDAQRRPHCQILPLTLNFGEYRGLRRVVERRIFLGIYDKLPIPRGVCNQQVVGSNPTAGSGLSFLRPPCHPLRKRLLVSQRPYRAARWYISFVALLYLLLV
jgi:hypothetical protein